jgi:hypothetical protein
MASSLVLLLLIALLTSWGYVRERKLRWELEDTIQSQQNLLAFIRHSDTIRRHWEAVEQAAVDPALRIAMKHTWDDPDLQRISRQLVDSAFESKWTALRQRMLSHSAREELQEWLQRQYDASDSEEVFAWFVQNGKGLQIARAPLDPQSIGQNYAWRSYFHGSLRDDRGTAEDREQTADRHLVETHLSTDFRTELTDREVVAVSTPIVIDDQFAGILGVFLYIVPPGSNSIR